MRKLSFRKGDSDNHPRSDDEACYAGCRSELVSKTCLNSRSTPPHIRTLVFWRQQTWWKSNAVTSNPAPNTWGSNFFRFLANNYSRKPISETIRDRDIDDLGSRMCWFKQWHCRWTWVTLTVVIHPYLYSWDRTSYFFRTNEDRVVNFSTVHKLVHKPMDDKHPKEGHVTLYVS